MPPSAAGSEPAEAFAAVGGWGAKSAGRDLDGATHARLYRESGGNPFYLERLARSAPPGARGPRCLSARRRSGVTWRASMTRLQCTRGQRWQQSSRGKPIPEISGLRSEPLSHLAMPGSGRGHVLSRYPAPRSGRGHGGEPLDGPLIQRGRFLFAIQGRHVSLKASVWWSRKAQFQFSYAAEAAAQASRQLT
jgi:hypothetical protein